MIIFQRLSRALRILALTDWSHLLVIILFLYLGGMLAMPYFEGADSKFVEPVTFTWWFIVTIMTVGYGDIAPTTDGGRAIGMLTMLIGITAIATAATKAFDAILRARRMKMEGKATFPHVGHLVIFGYTAGRTERLLRELRVDTAMNGHKVVLIADTVEINPLADQAVDFVRGDMSSDDVMLRGNVAQAQTIIIDAPTDDATTTIAIVTLNCNANAHVVAYATDPNRARILELLDNGRLEVIPSLTIALLAHSASDPGISEVIHALLAHHVDASIFREEYTGPAMYFGDLFDQWKKDHNVTLVGVKNNGLPLDVNPKRDVLVQAGAALYYIGDERKAA